MRHRVLVDHPQWRAHVEREEALREAEDSWRRKLRAESAEYEKAVMAHKEAKQRVLAAGQQPPPAPEPPPNRRDEAAHYKQEQTLLRAQRRDLLRSIRPDVEAAAGEREMELLDAARLLVDQLRPLAAELSQLGATLREVQTAANPGVLNRVQPPARVTIADLVEAIESDQRPLEPQRQEVRVS